MGILQSKLCFKTLRQQAKFWFLWLRIDFGESLQEQRNSIGRAKLFQNSAKVYVRYPVNYRGKASAAAEKREKNRISDHPLSRRPCRYRILTLV